MTRLARAAVATALVSASYLVGLAPSSNLHETRPGSPTRFQKDAHWNEAGNLLAAVCLYHYLEQDANLPRLSENGLREALYRYYAACRDQETGWTPGGRREKTVPVSSAALAGAQRQYSALDQAGEGFNYAAQRPGGAAPGALVRGGADVRIDGDRIVYEKAPPCRTDPGEPFFLHVAPADANDLADDGSRASGFDNIGFPDDFWRAEQNRCVGEHGLPDYHIAHLRTGQFDPQTDATTWEANFLGGDGVLRPGGGDVPGTPDRIGANAQIAAVNARFDELQGELRDLRALVTDAIKGAAPPD